MLADVEVQVPGPLVVPVENVMWYMVGVTTQF
jgi:hypothetical protein